MPSNAQYLASQPFTAFDENNSNQILKWDVASVYTSSTTVAEPGEGFWLVNKQSTNQIVFLTGEVALSPSNTALLCPGLNLVGYPYSSSLPLNRTTLGSLTTSVEILNADAKAPGKDESVMGKGYWVKSLSQECIVWTEVRPYKNVFPTSGLPDITFITTKDGSSVALSIACEGGELFDVFYQDVDSTNRFDTARNWQLAEAGFPANGQTSIEWIDSGADDRSAPGKILGRYYLVGRADIDLDRDGIPDAREQFVYGKTSANSVSLQTGVMGSAVASSADELAQGIVSATNAPEQTTTNLVQSPPELTIGRVIYVDQQTGDDACSGRNALRFGNDGPKKTVRGGLGACGSGGLVIIRAGKYGEALNVAGQAVTVRIEGLVDLTGAPRESEPPIVNSTTNH